MTAKTRLFIAPPVAFPFLPAGCVTTDTASRESRHKRAAESITFK